MERGRRPLVWEAAAAIAARPSLGSTLVEYALLVVVFAAVVYFTSIAPQRRRDREWRESMAHLRRGARVLTRGGVYGTVTEVRDDVVTVRVADKVEVRVNKNYIAEVLRPGSGEEGKGSAPGRPGARGMGMERARTGPEASPAGKGKDGGSPTGPQER
jgi:preprotein translocase subunit YajC